MKEAYKMADPVNGERKYNISQVVIGGASLATGTLTMITSVKMAPVQSGKLINYTGKGMTALPVIAGSNAIDAYNVNSAESSLDMSK